MPDYEKGIVKQSILKGARNMGSEDGIIFLDLVVFKTTHSTILTLEKLHFQIAK